MFSVSSLLLKSSILRKSIVTSIKSKYFHELGLSIPLNNNYWAHIRENDSYNSFSEIFIQQEYENFIPKEDLLKVIDLGAHYGYFSLWLQSKIGSDKFRSLLIEPSSFCRRSLEKLISQTKLQGRFKYLAGAVSDSQNQTTQFYDRPFMAGSKFNNSGNMTSKQVKIVRQDEIIATLPPPYDLIKCDIEGAEWDLIEHYQEILFQSKYLLMEWHSWHSGGGGLSQIIQGIRNLGFDLVKSSKPQVAEGLDGEVGLFLAHNQKFLG